MATLIKKSDLRYAHGNGRMDMVYTVDGKCLLTCGVDGEMRCFQGIDDDEPSNVVISHNASVHAIACHNKVVYIASDKNCVTAYTFPTFERSGLIARFTAPVTTLALSSDGSLLASGSCDMTVQVTNTTSYETADFRGHKGPILSVALDPKVKYVASSSGDGSVIIWEIKSKQVVKLFPDIFPKINDFNHATSYVCISWQTDNGRSLAIPKKGEVVLYQRGNWEQRCVFSDPNVTCYYITTSFSTCNQFLAATSIDGCLSVWDLNIGVLLLTVSYEPKNPLTGIVWNPDNELENNHHCIAVCDNTGCWGTVVFKFEPEYSDGSEATIELDDSIIEIKQEDKQEDVDDKEVSDGNSVSSSHSDRSSLTAGVEDKNMVEQLQQILVKQQAPFQPTSTPLHAIQRFMVCNDVGRVTAFDDDGNHVIEVEFTDSATHHTFTINNNLMLHTIACLSKEVLVLSGEKQEESQSSTIVCTLLSTSAGIKQWSTYLPQDEESLATAAGVNFIAVATSKNNLRLYTMSGTQRDILAIPGNIVCLAASHEKLMVVHYNSAGDQSMSMLLLEVGATWVKKLDSPSVLPMSPGVKLNWAGFSDEMSPCIYDRGGCLRVFAPSGLWHTLCDTTNSQYSKYKSKVDTLFLIGVNQLGHTMRGFLVKGADYPDILPRPNMVELPILIPVCESDTTKGQCENKYLRSKLCVAALCNNARTTPVDLKSALVERDTNMLAVFCLAVRRDQFMRACELYESMPTKSIQEMAYKSVRKYGKLDLLRLLDNVNLSNLNAYVAEDNSVGTQSTEDVEPNHSELPSTSASVLSAAKRAKVEDTLSSGRAKIVPAQFNPFGKTSDKQTLAPLPVKRPASTFKKQAILKPASTGNIPVRTEAETSKKVEKSTFNVFSKSAASVSKVETTKNGSDDDYQELEKIINNHPLPLGDTPDSDGTISISSSPEKSSKVSDENAQINQASKRNQLSQTDKEGDSKRMKISSKLQSFAFKKN